MIFLAWQGCSVHPALPCTAVYAAWTFGWMCRHCFREGRHLLWQILCYHHMCASGVSHPDIFIGNLEISSLQCTVVCVCVENFVCMCRHCLKANIPFVNYRCVLPFIALIFTNLTKKVITNWENYLTFCRVLHTSMHFQLLQMLNRTEPTVAAGMTDKTNFAKTVIQSLVNGLLPQFWTEVD